MAASIMQTEKECYITHRTDNLHKHHVYFGNPGRRLSEQYGCWVWLTGEWHNQSNHGVHFDPVLDRELKVECQFKFEALLGHEEFMRVFGRSYI